MDNTLMKQPANCKYTPLENYLCGPSGTWSELTLTFEQIEIVMHSKLPKSAYIRTTWWDNAVHSTLSPKSAWPHAGWHVGEVNLSAKWVHLFRIVNQGAFT
jgi:hypothetical protein